MNRCLLLRALVVIAAVAALLTVPTSIVQVAAAGDCGGGSRTQSV